MEIDVVMIACVGLDSERIVLSYDVGFNLL